jgi:hypothetical protein
MILNSRVPLEAVEDDAETCESICTLLTAFWSLQIKPLDYMKLKGKTTKIQHICQHKANEKRIEMK